MKFLKRLIITIGAILLALFIWGKIYYYSQPSVVSLPGIADTTRIKTDLTFLTKNCVYRNHLNIDQLNKAADYIHTQFSAISDSVTEQLYTYDTIHFRNIICSLGPKDAERIIVGAHYDVCDNFEGADDNASGVAGLLELARLLKSQALKYRIDFVAYAAEEPPFFRSKYMGSYVHAKYLLDNNIKVKGMICIEMIGYFSEEEGSQSYPFFPLRWFYGSKGNYITAVQKFENGKFGNAFVDSIKAQQVLPTRSFIGPKWLPGVDFSDHLNYWKFGYSAVMITNTAFYRNKNYHTADDAMEMLNISKMSMVIDEVYRAILKVD